MKDTKLNPFQAKAIEDLIETELPRMQHRSEAQIEIFVTEHRAIVRINPPENERLGVGHLPAYWLIKPNGEVEKAEVC